MTIPAIALGAALASTTAAQTLEIEFTGTIDEYEAFRINNDPAQALDLGGTFRTILEVDLGIGPDLANANAALYGAAVTSMTFELFAVELGQTATFVYDTPSIGEVVTDLGSGWLSIVVYEPGTFSAFTGLDVFGVDFGGDPLLGNASFENFTSGDFFGGIFTGGTIGGDDIELVPLDGVIQTVRIIPAPASLSLLAVSSVATARRRRRS